MDVMNDHPSNPLTNTVDTMMDGSNDVILKDVNNLLPAEKSNVTDLPDVKRTSSSPSKTRDGPTSRSTTPRCANQRRKVELSEPSPSLMDQLDLLMGLDATGKVTSPSKSAGIKKKPTSKEAETDDFTRESSSEHHDALANSERSASKNRNSSTTRSKSELPKIPRSPQRKKKVLSIESTSTESDIGHGSELPVDASMPQLGDRPFFDNNVLDTNLTDPDRKKLPPSPRRVKHTIKKQSDDENASIDSKLLDVASERSTKSSSSTTTRVRTRKVATESGAPSTTVSDAKSNIGMESSSERPSRSSSRLRKKQISPSESHEEKHSDQKEAINQVSATEKSSFCMEPILALKLESIARTLQLPLAENLDASTASASVVSESDEMASTPLLLRSCERSESLRRSSISMELSDDILDRLNRSSLSDIEKSGIGVERSIKKTIQSARAKKNGASTPSLSCCHSTAQVVHDNNTEASVDTSVSIDHLKVASDLEEDYIEEIIDDDCNNIEEAATMNSSTTLSLVAAEMDEAMTKIWAKFDEKIKNSSTDQNVVVERETADHHVPAMAPPTKTVDPRAGPIDGIAENSDTASTDDDKNSVTATATEIRKKEETEMLKPDDTRLSSLVKLLVVDAWSNNIGVVTACLEEMRVLCETDENAVTEMFQHGGHLVVIVLMRRHIEHANVQIAALLTLQKAAECRNEFTDAIISLGALELILTTIKNHDDNEDVVTAGCGALLNLTLPAKHANVFVFELHGIQTIAHVSAKFPSKIALQKYSLWMIQYFSYWENYKKQIVQQGGMQTLAKMIESFSSMINNNIDLPDCSSNNKAAIESIVKAASATMKRLL